MAGLVVGVEAAFEDQQVDDGVGLADPSSIGQSDNTSFQELDGEDDWYGNDTQA